MPAFRQRTPQAMQLPKCFVISNRVGQRRPATHHDAFTARSIRRRRPPISRKRPLRTDATQDCLRLEVGLEPEDAEFAADARLLEPTEGRRRIVWRAVYDDTPSLDMARHCQRPSRVGRDDISLQPIGRVIGDRDRLRLVLIGKHAQHRAENLFPGDRHIVVDVREDGRLHEITAEAVGMAFATGDNGCARLDAKPDVALNPLVLSLTDHRPDRRVRITRRARLDLPEGGLGLRIASSNREAGTRMRVPAMQAWPLFAKPASSASGIAFAKSASSRITVGDLPPSSRVTRFSVSAAARRIALPTAVEPVNEIFDISGFAVISAPTTSPRPLTTLNRPAGPPASWRASSTTCV